MDFHIHFEAELLLHIHGMQLKLFYPEVPLFESILHKIPVFFYKWILMIPHFWEADMLRYDEKNYRAFLPAIIWSLFPPTPQMKSLEDVHPQSPALLFYLPVPAVLYVSLFLTDL